MCLSVNYLFSDREHSCQWCNREGERDDARVYDAQIGRAMYFKVGRDDTWTKHIRRPCRQADKGDIEILLTTQILRCERGRSYRMESRLCGAT
jgi:hypothetical protein